MTDPLDPKTHAEMYTNAATFLGDTRTIAAIEYAVKRWKEQWPASAFHVVVIHPEHPCARDICEDLLQAPWSDDLSVIVANPNTAAKLWDAITGRNDWLALTAKDNDSITIMLLHKTGHAHACLGTPEMANKMKARMN